MHRCGSSMHGGGPTMHWSGATCKCCSGCSVEIVLVILIGFFGCAELVTRNCNPLADHHNLLQSRVKLDLNMRRCGICNDTQVSFPLPGLNSDRFANQGIFTFTSWTRRATRLRLRSAKRRRVSTLCVVSTLLSRTCEYATSAPNNKDTGMLRTSLGVEKKLRTTHSLDSCRFAFVRSLGYRHLISTANLVSLHIQSDGAHRH
mmetsp:Transcript_101595/g.152224  ORF Transcript_101595/g.152224 Transcript_101595/m.152224 type:complete len:203 (-) Transcript_101595:2237-2845(-)